MQDTIKKLESLMPKMTCEQKHMANNLLTVLFNADKIGIDKEEISETISKSENLIKEVG